MSSSGRIAFLDESYYDSSQMHLYTMTSAVIDLALRDSYSTLMKALESIARRQPGGGLHAVELAYAAETQEDLVAAQGAITACSAVRLTVATKSPQNEVRTMEDCRQVCLADLITRIQESGPVDKVTLDTRDNLGVSRESARPKLGGYNERDMMTIDALRRSGAISRETKVFHANDYAVRQLWIPDVVGYVVARSIVRNDPAYMRILASKVKIYEAGPRQRMI